METTPVPRPPTQTFQRLIRQHLSRQQSAAHSQMLSPLTMASRLLIMWLCMSLPSSREAAMLSAPDGAAAGCTAGLAAWRAAAELVLLAAAPRGPAADDVTQSATWAQSCPEPACAASTACRSNNVSRCSYFNRVQQGIGWEACRI